MTDVYTLHFDGSCWPNPGGTAAYGYKLQTPTGTLRDHGVIGTGPNMSNNVSEYFALCKGLESFLEINKASYCILRIYGDSQLVINQMNKKWKIKEGLYKEYADKAVGLKITARKRGAIVSFDWIPRDKNEDCDILSKLHLEKK